MISQGDISTMLRQARIERGLSLAEVARRADTSAASVSRYEHGWTRFEVYTLGKLASALGCELRVELRPGNRHRPKTEHKAVFKRLRRLFWDVPFTAQVMESNPVWAVERVIDYGTLDDVRGLIAVLGRDKFMAYVARSIRVSPRTRAFWNQMLKKEGLPCIQRSFRNTALSS